jgi:hypothetical protein
MEVPMKKRSDREAVIDAVLADLRRTLESELPGENATLEQIEDVAHRLGLELQRGLQQRLATAGQGRSPEWLPQTEEAIRRVSDPAPELELLRRPSRSIARRTVSDRATSRHRP